MDAQAIQITTTSIFVVLAAISVVWAIHFYIWWQHGSIEVFKHGKSV